MDLVTELLQIRHEDINAEEDLEMLKLLEIGMKPETGVVHVAGKSEADFVGPLSS